MKSDDKISSISKCISGEILPNHPSIKAQFYQDISSKYEGDAIVYLIQEVGKAFYQIILGVVGAFLYDYIKKKMSVSSLKNRICNYYDRRIIKQLQNMRFKIRDADRETINLKVRDRRYFEKILDDYKGSMNNLEDKNTGVDRLTELLIKYSSFNEKAVDIELRKQDKSIEEFEKFLEKNKDNFITFDPERLLP